MQRVHAYIVGSALLVLAVVLFIFSVAHHARNESTPKEKEPGYTSFTVPTNTFEVFQSDAPNLPNTRATSTLSETEREQALKKIIEDWEDSKDPSDARSYTSLTLPEKRTTEEIEKDEIRTLFNNLIGPKVGDTLTTAYVTENSGSSDVLWSGQYNNTEIIKTEDTETEIQQALRAYGNDLGALLRTFEQVHSNQLALLDDFFENREDAVALKALTNAYVQLASDISEITAPPQVATSNTSLIAAYTAVGELMWDLTDATNDAELLERLLTYNTAAEDVAKNHVALITLFKAHGVEFENHEPGSVFSFTPSTGSGL